MKAKRHGRSKSDREKGTIRRPAVQFSAIPAASQDNEESLQTFFNALDDLVFVFDPEGRILFANPAAQNLLGYTPAELAGMAALDLHPPEQRQEAAKLLAGVIAGKITICPIPLQARDGTRILVETKILHGQWRGKDALFGISHDITKRKQAEEAMRESEEKYKALIETTGTGYVILDSEGKVLGANQEYVRLTGHGSLTEIIGKSVIEWTAAQDRERNVAEIRKCFQQGFVRNLEIDYVKQGGQVTPVEINATVVKSGQVVHVLALCRDITERKLAEEAMQESEERFHQLFDDAPIGYHEIDREGRITRVNRTELDMLGYTIEEMLRQPVWKFIGEEKSSQQTVLAKLAGTLPPDQGYERTFRRKDQTTFPVLIEDRILHDAEGRIAGMRSVMQDITARKRADEALANERALLRTLVDHLPMAIYLKDLAGRKTLVNRVELDYVGAASEAEVLGKTDFDFFPQEQAAGYHAIDQEIIRTGQPVINREGSFTKPDGSVIHVLGSVVPLRDVAGRVTGLAGITLDITARKRAEEALRMNEERLLKVITQTRCILYSGHVTGPEGWRKRALERVSPFHWDTPVVNEQTAQKIVPLELAAGEPYMQAWERSWNRADAAQMNWNSGNAFLNDLPFYRNEFRCTDKHGVGHWIQEFVTVQKLAENRWQIFSIAMDISDLKRVETELRESQALYHSLVDQMPAGVFRKDAEGRFTFVNSEFCRLKEMPPEQFLGKTVMEVGSKDVALAIRSASHHATIMQSGKQIEDEEVYTSATGEMRNYHAVKSPVFDSAGKVVGTQGVLFDITDRKSAEKALRQGEMRLERINRCLLELGPNFDSNINRLTALCGELLGATCALYNRLQGDLLCSIGQWQTPPGFKSEDAPAGHICYDVIRNNQEGAVVITNLPRTSYAESDPNVRAYGLQTYMGCAVKREGKAVGSLCVVYNTDYRPTDDDRRILGIIASAIGNEDTRKQAEAELNRLMTAIEQTPESVVITDTDGRILYVNPVFERVTGYSRAEVIGQNTRLLKSNRQDSAFYRQLWAKISAGEVWRGRFINKKKDGTLFTEDAVIAPVRDEKGAVTNYIAIKRDITHELELEVQYRQTQKIDSIGRLAGGVAHDFNNILAVICGHTELALAQLSPDAPLRSNLECIQESAERAANLTRQLLAFARRQVIEPRRINLNELIVNLNKMLRRLIGEDIKLVTQTAPDLGQIKADPGQIEQVLLNLVVNARDAMPDGGTLTIRTANVTLDESYARRHLVTPGDYVMVSVSDTGVGMTDEVKQHIFEPFFTTKEQGKGTGLGLATCFGIIQQSNGHIHSESQLDKGTQFKIYLPRVWGVEDSVSSREAPVSLPQGTETILLAEDEPSLRQLMARVLRTQGYTVLEAADGHASPHFGAGERR